MYYRIRQQVLDALKWQAKAANRLAEDAFFEGSAQGGLKGCYSLRSVNDNLAEPIAACHLAEFAAGRSREASLGFLGSSYAMLYNLLGNQIAFVDGKPYRISYKRRLRTLKSKNAYTSLDAVLLSEDGDTCICVEAKLIEWFVFKVNPLKDTFLHSENYHEPQAAECFMNAFRMLVPYYQSDSYEHFGCLKQYDGFLVLRQLLALYHTIWEEQRRSARGSNAPAPFADDTQMPEGECAACGYCAAQNDDTYAVRRALARVHTLVYENVYWHARDPSYYGSYGAKIGRARKRMEQEEMLFRELTERIVLLFRETLDIDLQLRLSEHRQFLERVALTEEKKAWLKRYDL